MRVARGRTGGGLGVVLLARGRRVRRLVGVPRGRLVSRLLGSDRRGDRLGAGDVERLGLVDRRRPRGRRGRGRRVTGQGGTELVGPGGTVPVALLPVRLQVPTRWCRHLALLCSLRWWQRSPRQQPPRQGFEQRALQICRLRTDDDQWPGGRTGRRSWRRTRGCPARAATSSSAGPWPRSPTPPPSTSSSPPATSTWCSAVWSGWAGCSRRPAPGLPRFLGLSTSSDPDVAWIMHDNRGKARLAKLL